MRDVTVSEAGELLGITTATLNTWIRKGLVGAEGTPRRLDAMALVSAALMVARDLSPDVQNMIATAVRDNWRSGLAQNAGYLLVMPEVPEVKWSLELSPLAAVATRYLSRPGLYRQVLLVDLGALATWAEAQTTEPEPLPEPVAVAVETEPLATVVESDEPETEPLAPMVTVLELDAQRDETRATVTDEE